MLSNSHITRFRENPICILSPGQGTAQPGMGQEAFDNSAEAQGVYRVGQLITGINLADVCFGDQTDQLSKTEIAQPALSAAALAEFLYLREMGFRPDAGLGHSMGEIPLLAMAEVITVEGMFRLIKERGAATARANALRPGRMAVSLMLNTEQLEDSLGDLLKSGRLVIANFNSTLQHGLSGDEDFIRQAREVIRRKAESVIELKDAKLRPLRIPGAFHSPYHMQPAKRRFGKAAKSIDYSRPRFDIMLNNGLYLDELGLTNLPHYLTGQLAGKVLFSKGVERLVKDGVTNFVQIGDRPVLSDLIVDDYGDSVNIVEIKRVSRVKEEAET